MSDNVSVLEKHRAQQKKHEHLKAPAEAMRARETPPEGKQPYKAWGRDKPKNRTTKIRIEYNNGEVQNIAKSYTTGELYGANCISLVQTDYIITLEGENLLPLMELLQLEEVLSLHEFDAARHELPPPGEAVIHSIQRRMHRELMG